MNRTPETTAERGSGNVFLDIGFTPTEAAELIAKYQLMVSIKDAIERRG